MPSERLEQVKLTTARFLQDNFAKRGCVSKIAFIMSKKTEIAPKSSAVKVSLWARAVQAPRLESALTLADAMDEIIPGLGGDYLSDLLNIQGLTIRTSCTKPLQEALDKALNNQALKTYWVSREDIRSHLGCRVRERYTRAKGDVKIPTVLYLAEAIAHYNKATAQNFLCLLTGRKIKDEDEDEGKK